MTANEFPSFPPWRVPTIEKCLENLLINIDVIGDAVNVEDLIELSERNKAILQVVEDFFREEFVRRHSDRWKYNPRRLPVGQPGIYLGVRPNGSKKFGMSNFSVKDRCKAQHFSQGAMVLSANEVDQIVAEEYVTRIRDLQPDSLACHPDRQHRNDRLIRLQLCEAFLACAHGFFQGVLERLFVPASDEVEQDFDFALELKNPKVQAMIENLRGLPDGSMDCLLTWPMLSFRLRKIAETSSDEGFKNLVPPAPPEGDNCCFE